MQRVFSSMPGYRLNEYLLVLSPNEELRSRIIGIRKEFHEKYSTKAPLTGKPHIALVRFVTWNMLEDKIASRLKHIGLGITPFKIELKDFSTFPTHTLFLNVATKAPVQNLVKEIRSVQKLMKADPEHDPLFISDPFVPIARKLLPWQYEKGWLEYSQRRFTARMMADSMLLLKRPLGERAYQIVERFEFMNMPVATRQGELFI